MKALLLVVAVAALAASALQIDPFAGHAHDNLASMVGAANHTTAAPAPAHPFGKHTRGVITTRQCGGLYNQYAALVGVISLAHTLNMTVVVPPCSTRSTMQRGDAGEWRDVPAAHVFDIAHLRAALPELELVDESPATAAWVATLGEPARVPKTFSKPAAYFVDALLSRTRTGAPRDRHLRLPCAQFVYAPTTLDEVHYVKRVEAALRFNETLRADAADIVRRLGGANAYSGFHMRCEPDAQDAWGLGCESPLVNSRPLISSGLDPRLPLYVATGEPADTRYVDVRYHTVTHEDFGDYVARYEGALDVVAAIDALVLHSSARFVGFGTSSFSFFVARQRERGISGPSRLVHGPSEATHGVFEAAFPQ